MSNDRIVYTVVSDPSGCDGMDMFPSTILLVTFDRNEADRKANTDSRYLLKKHIIDIDDARKAALAKLTPIDILILVPTRSNR
jgi:hypothetical protein